jgi:Ca2+-binding RTX toxin-like protein
VFAVTHDSSGAARFITFGRMSESSLVGQVGQVLGVDSNITSRPSVAMHADGSFVIGYEEADGSVSNPTQSKGYAQRFDAAGNPQGDRIALGVAAFNRGVHEIGVDALSSGGFVAAFQQTTSGPTETVYARQYNSEGVAQGVGPIPLARHNLHDDAYLAGGIGADDNGSVVVAFFDDVAGESHYRRATVQPAAIDRSTLYVLGTESGESMFVERIARSYVVTRRGAVRRFDATQVAALSMSGFGGPDLMLNETSLPSIMDGGPDGDDMHGGTANDLMYGRDGNDRIWAASGNDTLDGGTGIDQLRGEAGNDRLVSQDGLVDQLWGHDGRDTAVADGDDVLRMIEVVQ